jgi:UDP-3-O-[3-hydroxymyristoyl] glucosamine N-acyltransferase
MMNDLKIPLKTILSAIECYVERIYGNIQNVYVSSLGNLDTQEPNAIGWIAPYKLNQRELLLSCKLKVVICDTSIVIDDSIDKVVIAVHNPRLVYILIAEKFFKSDKISEISPYSRIYTNSIGEGCVIADNVVIYDNVVIGDNCTIQAGCIIGNDGLGCERDEFGILHKFPHFGKVIIEDNVDIGPNCQIVRGTLSDTLIGSGTKIDGLCSIGHNSKIGKNNWIASSVMIAGSVSIGDNNIIFAATKVKDQITIGDSSIIGMGAVVTRDSGNKELWYGSPAKKVRAL